MIRDPGRVDASHWAAVRERLLLKHDRWRQSASTDFDHRLFFRSRLRLWWVDYSAGVELVELRDRFEDLLAEWVGSGLSMWGPIEAVGSIATCLGLSPMLAPLLERQRSPSDRPHRRLDRWYIADPEAMTHPDYAVDIDHVLLPPGLWNLIEVAEADPVAAAPVLEEYVCELWYPEIGEGGDPQYETHVFNPDAYDGYWSWPAAAVARRCGVDDSPLRGHEYYPYDLAHFLDEHN